FRSRAARWRRQLGWSGDRRRLGWRTRPRRSRSRCRRDRGPGAPRTSRRARRTGRRSCHPLPSEVLGAGEPVDLPAELGDDPVPLGDLVEQVTDDDPVDPAESGEGPAAATGEPGVVVTFGPHLTGPERTGAGEVERGAVVAEGPVPEDPGGGGDGPAGGTGQEESEILHGWSPISRAIRRVRARSAAAPAAMPAARTRAAAATAFTAPPLGGLGRARRRSPGRSAGRPRRRAAPWCRPRRRRPGRRGRRRRGRRGSERPSPRRS